LAGKNKFSYDKSGDLSAGSHFGGSFFIDLWVKLGYNFVKMLFRIDGT
jgi:hypothetical protein